MSDDHDIQFSLLKKWLFLQGVFEDSDLSSSAKLICARLLYHLNSYTGRCDPSLQTLAEGIGRDRQSAKRAIKELDDRGWLTAKCSYEGGRPRPHSFVFNFERCKVVDGVENDPIKVDPTKDLIGSKMTLNGVKNDPNHRVKNDPWIGSNMTPEHRKRNKEKEIGNLNPLTDPTDFDRFWAAYPHHGRGKSEASGLSRLKSWIEVF